MKVLTKLQLGEVAEAPAVMPDSRCWVASQPAPGCIRKVCLTSAGVTVMRGTADSSPLQVQIPLDEILRLAEAAEPGLALAASAQEAK